ncbi:RWP-RK domain containing protein [Quillaja saponaria]|uniref:RWP-RK domain containing protein n=1 Tax=Quillaja saponaria TaxID=32244 RepID=A0AAD7LXC8_QUISA|nr:RWP-RK domain containing protein [Quillaja saponaria]KAJ7965072.1 RWP-RK domain containing protein [Quillaja saponaria]
MVSIGGHIKSSSQLTNNERSKLPGVTTPLNLQQQGSKNVQIGRPQNLLSTSLTKGIITVDEFKYGFPSDGLSIASNKWWGSDNPDGYEGVRRDGAEVGEDGKDELKDSADDGSSSRTVNKETCEKGAALLTAVRKRTVKEGKEAFKLGVFRGYDVTKLSNRQKTLLHQIFDSSLPKSWISGS